MPQEFHALRCYSCGTFQVQIVKKSNKWCCKMCGEKQSLKKVYVQGTSKDCRVLVQSLNEKRMIYDLNESENINNEFAKNDIEEEKSSSTAMERPKSSKWSDYLSEENQSDSECDTNSHYTFERRNKRKLIGKKDSNSSLTEKKQKLKHVYEEDIENKFTSICNYVEPNIHAGKELQAKQHIIKNEPSKWSSFVTNQEDHLANCKEVENNFTLEYNSAEYNLNSDKEIKQQISEESKWSSFVRNEEDSASTENTFDLKNIFNTTEVNSLDDILEL